MRVEGKYAFFFFRGTLSHQSWCQEISGMTMMVVLGVTAQNNCSYKNRIISIQQKLEQTKKSPEKHHMLIIFNPQAIVLRVPHLQLTGDCVQGAIKPGRRTRKDFKLFNFKVSISKRENKDLAPRLYYCFLTVPVLFLHSLPSLISNCLNLSLGIHGRPWRLKEAHFLRTRNWGHRKAFVPRSLTGSCSVTMVGSAYFSWWDLQNSLIFSGMLHLISCSSLSSILYSVFSWSEKRASTNMQV